MTPETKNDVRILIHRIRRAYPDSVTTYNPCPNQTEECTSARGSDVCPNCLENELTEIVGVGLAHAFHSHTKTAAYLIGKMLND